MIERIRLYEQGERTYNPETKKNELIMNPLGLFYGNKSPLKETTQQSMFGEIGTADTVFRFMGSIPESAKRAEWNNKKFEVVTLRNYGSDAVIYVKEVSQW